MSGMPPLRQMCEHEALVMALAAGSADPDSRCVEPSCAPARVLNHGLDVLEGAGRLIREIRKPDAAGVRRRSSSSARPAQH
jgi:hypothetical protein